MASVFFASGPLRSAASASTGGTRAMEIHSRLCEHWPDGASTFESDVMLTMCLDLVVAPLVFHLGGQSLAFKASLLSSATRGVEATLVTMKPRLATNARRYTQRRVVTSAWLEVYSSDTENLELLCCSQCDADSSPNHA